MVLSLFAAFVAFAPLDVARVNVPLRAEHTSRERNERQRAVTQTTVPLIVVGNRPFIDLTFKKSDGSTRTARFLLDTGGGGFLMTESLARDLGMKWGETMREEGAEFAAPTSQPSVFVKDFALQLNPKRVAILVGKSNMLPPVAPGTAEGMIPGHVLAQYHVVFDYPAASFTIALPGELAPKGTALEMPVSKVQGFPRTEIKVAGTTYGVLLDTGASFTMISELLLASWGTQHPKWPRDSGAVGDAKTLGGMTLETMTASDAMWGQLPIKELGVVSQRAGTFEKYMSGMMTAPIVGSLAGNVLKHFRVELDYANQKLYLTPEALR